MVSNAWLVYLGRAAGDSVVADGSAAKSFAGNILWGSSGECMVALMARSQM